MALPKFEKDIGYVSKLDDQPNDVGGLSADELKGVFDKAALELQDYINNTLVPQITSDIDSAAQGVGSGGAISGDKLADNSVSAAKLVDGSVGTAKLADNSVVADKIADGAVGTAKLADTGIATGKIADSAVTKEKIADSAVSSNKIFAGAVTTEKLHNEAVTAEKIANNAVSQLYTTTIPATGDGWTTGENYLTYVAPVEGLLSSDIPIVDVNLSGKSGAELVELAEAWGTALRVGVNTSGSFYAYFSEVPTIDIPIKIMVVRK